MNKAPESRTSPHRRQLFKKLIRFGLVGGTSTLLFAVLTWLAVEKFSIRPTLATGIAYLSLIPPNFVAHKFFTFGSQGNLRHESGKFLTIHALNLSLATIGMAAVEAMHLDYRLGIAFSTIVVPIIVFFLMDIWVFNHQPRAH